MLRRLWAARVGVCCFGAAGVLLLCCLCVAEVLLCCWLAAARVLVLCCSRSSRPLRFRPGVHNRHTAAPARAAGRDWGCGAAVGPGTRAGPGLIGGTDFGRAFAGAKYAVSPGGQAVLERQPGS
jgi:hypothetical protein